MDWYWLAENQLVFDSSERRFGIWHCHIRLGDHYSPQASNINETPTDARHSDRYREIVDELDQDLTGHNFLVGAGLLWKMYYCACIKKSGG